MGAAASAMGRGQDDFPGTSFIRNRRQQILSAPITKEEEKILRIPLTKWRANETQEQKEERKKIYKSTDFHSWRDIAKWSDIGWDSGTKSEMQPNEEINALVSLTRVDILGLEVDAVVNAANNAFLGGGGIDGAIHDAAGSLLLRDVAGRNGLATGRAKITKGYNLPARYIIHTAGPTTENEDELISSYTKCLDLATKFQIRTIAFCCISTGIFGFDLSKATHIALKTVRQYLENSHNRARFDRIIFVMFLAKEEKTYNELMPVYFPLKQPKNPMPENPVKKENEEKLSARLRHNSGADNNSSSPITLSSSFTLPSASGIEPQKKALQTEIIAISSEHVKQHEDIAVEQESEQQAITKSSTENIPIAIEEREKDI